jgi:chromosome segregation ATPase
VGKAIDINQHQNFNVMIRQKVEIKKNEIEILENNIIIIMQDMEIIKNKIVLSQTGIDYLEKMTNTESDDLEFFRNHIASDSTFLLKKQRDLDAEKLQLDRSRQELKKFENESDAMNINYSNIETEIDNLKKEIEYNQEKINDFNRTISENRNETQRHMSEFKIINDRVIAVKQVSP